MGFIIYMVIGIIFGLSLFADELFSSGSYDRSSDCVEDYTVDNLTSDIATVCLTAAVLDSAYKKDVELEVDRQRLLERDPMAEFRV